MVSLAPYFSLLIIGGHFWLSSEAPDFKNSLVGGDYCAFEGKKKRG